MLLYKFLKFTKSSKTCNCTVRGKTLIYSYNMNQHQSDTPSIKPAFLNTNFNLPTLKIYKADKGINNEGHKLPSTKLSGFVEGSLCPSQLYITKRYDKRKKKKKNTILKLHNPSSIVN